jgi:hypothetical protein
MVRSMGSNSRRIDRRWLFIPMRSGCLENSVSLTPAYLSAPFSRGWVGYHGEKNGAGPLNGLEAVCWCFV